MDLSIEDFEQQYSKTFVRNKDDPSDVWFIEGVDYDNVIGKSVKTGNFIKTFKDFMDKIMLDPPETGFFNHRNTALFLVRLPHRQWKRGICNKTYAIFNPMSKLFVEGFYIPKIGYSVVTSIFKSIRTYTNPWQVSDIILPWSKHLAISLDPTTLNSEKFLLWWDLTPVGWASEKDGLDILDMELQQEVLDEIVSEGIKL